MVIQYSIEWHKKCLYNWQRALSEREQKVNQELESIKNDRYRLSFYMFQIEEAEKMNKSIFDRDKFKVKRGSR